MESHLNRVFGVLCLVAALAACNKEPEGRPGEGPDPVIPSDWTVCGCVEGNDGKKLRGVVVSDGVNCTATDAEGMYYLKASKDASYITVSTPSNYSAPVEKALPIYYKWLDAFEPQEDGRYIGVDFKLNKIDNPECFTIFFSADPQPRGRSAGYDNIGYHSLDCVDDLMRDQRETAESISADRPVYGIVLGDVCHNNADLFPGYVESARNNGFPSYYVIGNHDHDLKIAGDKASAVSFEKAFGPSNYSFNLGNLHIVVLDNMIVSEKPRTTNSDTALADGLRDDIYEWLKNDLSFVSKDTPLMICAHSPMFMCMGAKMRSRGTITMDGQKFSSHYSDVDLLIKDYSKVYAWAGHTHTMYNYVDKNNPRVESHTLSRTTGELWTNEYTSSGTPRGYVILDYDYGDVKWKFHPIPYQSGDYQGSKAPDYKWRNWNYVDGVAKMKEDGSRLDDSYQMNVYPPGTYNSNDGLVYVEIFMWDELWKTPKFNFNGASQKMKRVNPSSNYVSYDYGQWALQSWYKANNATLNGASGYSASTSGSSAVFTASVQSQAAGKNKGTVSVEDRFGNTYTSVITW